MKNASRSRVVGILAACLAMAGCGKKFNPASGEVSQAPVTEVGNPGIVAVQNPEQYPVVMAGRVDVPSELSVTGSVFPDIDREVPVISLASGRVVDIRARLDDNVRKGQLLLKVQSPDVTNAFDTYLKAVNDEQLADKAYIRAKDLYAHGAIPEAGLEQAQDTEQDAKADLTAADQLLKTLGVDKDHPSSIVNVYAPISGVIVAQNVTNAAAAGVTYSGSSTAFTIADLSVVWIICDVYQNELPQVRLGQEARIAVDGYPGKVFTGRVSDIGPVLDPTIRTAKVRIEVPNPGLFRLGMYVTATLLSRTKTAHAVVPATAILHLHDRNWVFEPAGGNQFRRVAVVTGDMLPGNMQEILSGIEPGQQVVKDVLQLEATVEEQ
ncbi:MAG TPA: efflux RND transporter periplasmic adaptor subunit [Terracidiphilus sp.]|nr:efflux RND transporter periplasmic adaptor subunit [Terracidiphilus sp.]